MYLLALAAAQDRPEGTEAAPPQQEGAGGRHRHGLHDLHGSSLKQRWGSQSAAAGRRGRPPRVRRNATATLPTTGEQTGLHRPSQKLIEI